MTREISPLEAMVRSGRMGSPTFGANPNSISSSPDGPDGRAVPDAHYRGVRDRSCPPHRRLVARPRGQHAARAAASRRRERPELPEVLLELGHGL